MTTIAVRDGVMSSDTQATGGYAMRVEKLARLPDGGVVGGCGNARLAGAAIRWMIAGEAGDAPMSTDEDSYFGLLILRPDGSIWLADGGFPAFRLFDKFASVGSGSNLAMAAMEMGATSIEAVKVAAKYDEGTNDKVRSMSIDKPSRKRGK